MALAGRMLGVDERERHEGTAILGPARNDRQAIEIGRLDDVENGAARAALQANAKHRAADVARAPQLRRRGRQQRLDEADDATDQRERTGAEREFSAPRRAEQVCDEGESTAADVREEQRRPAGSNDAPVDLARFLARVDRRVSRDKVAIPPQSIEKRAEIRERRHDGEGSALPAAQLADDVELALG